MAITTCATLKTAIADYLGRSDLTNTGDFVTLFESHFNRRMRVRQMETTTTLTPTDGQNNLPDDFLALRRLTLDSSTRVPLEYVTPDGLERYHPTDSEGDPRSFTIEAGHIKVRPIDDDTDLILTYYAKLTPLSDDADTNWLLTQYPDAYLFGSLVEANAFVQNPEAAMLWAQRRDLVLDQLEKLSAKSTGPAAIRSAGPIV